MAMFLFRKRVFINLGIPALMVARMLAAFICHTAEPACGTADCHAPRGEVTWCAKHAAHEHDCVCVAEVVREKFIERNDAKIHSAPANAPRVETPAWTPLRTWRARVEKPPPGLVIKQISQKLC